MNTSSTVVILSSHIEIIDNIEIVKQSQLENDYFDKSFDISSFVSQNTTEVIN